MAKFIYKCCLIIVAVALAIFVLMTLDFFRMQKKVNTEYVINPGQDILFLGSSDTTFSISNESCWHNKIVTVYSTPVQAACARLLEFERRGQLDNVKTVVLMFGYRSIVSQNDDMVYFSWYHELPVSWRYLSYYPGPWWKYGYWVLTSLRFPFGFVIQQRPSEGLEPLPNRPEAIRHKIYEGARNEAGKLTFSISPNRPIDWEISLRQAIETMLAACKRHNIRFVVTKTEVIKNYDESLTNEFTANFESFVTWIRSLGIEYINLDCKYGDGDFYDACHLNDAGKKKFTARLYERLQQK